MVLLLHVMLCCYLLCLLDASCLNLSEFILLLVCDVSVALLFILPDVNDNIK